MLYIIFKSGHKEDTTWCYNSCCGQDRAPLSVAMELSDRVKEDAKEAENTAAQNEAEMNAEFLKAI